jgi:hypothetical protein
MTYVDNVSKSGKSSCCAAGKISSPSKTGVRQIDPRDAFVVGDCPTALSASLSLSLLDKKKLFRGYGPNASPFIILSVTVRKPVGRCLILSMYIKPLDVLLMMIMTMIMIARTTGGRDSTIPQYTIIVLTGAACNGQQQGL